MRSLERAHQLHADADESAARRAVCDLGRYQPGAPRRGRPAQPAGWAERSGCSSATDALCAERGYLLLPVMFQHEATGDFAAAAATAAEAVEIGQRFGDPDLVALAATCRAAR